ncbi:MAG TPA: hypothetical protein PLH02_03780 [Bacillota bacterium]|jgi:hypothetical protein|nr:hypothetical protein [Bacillota bacterium]HPQ61972.1 hypothetical protein [Bacillota bacterium]
MKLDFKGIITKEALEKDLKNLDPIMENNDYAIVVEDGVGKFVIFSMDFVKYRLELIDEEKSRNRLKISPYTLVESMIQTLEELPEKKTTAIMLSSLVEKYYGKKVTPMIIRTRAEENANGQGEVDYFIIEPNNTIGLSENSSFDLYMYNKMKRSVEYELNKLFKNDDYVELNNALGHISRMLVSTYHQKYAKDITNKDIIKMIKEFNRFTIDNNYIKHM